MFLPCRPCCEQVLLSEGCLDSCKQPGESGTLSSIEFTLDCSDYEFDCLVDIGPKDVGLAFTFPGSLYSGTIGLTNVSGSLWRYSYPTCAGQTPVVEFNLSTCIATFDFVSLLYFDTSVADGTYATPPTCATATHSLCLQQLTKSFSSCGVAARAVGDGSEIADPDGFGGFDYRTIYNAAFNYNSQADSAVQVNQCGGAAYLRIFGLLGFTNYIPDTSTITESGTASISVTNIQAVYA